MRSKLMLVLLSLLLTSGYAEAHKMRSVLLTLTEQPSTANDSASRVVINLKSSLNKNGQPAAITLRFTPECSPQGSSLAERLDDAVLRRYTVICEGKLIGRVVRINGLSPTTPDAFVEIHLANGETSRHGLSRSNSSITISANDNRLGRGLAQLSPYFGIGVEHILQGLDHLLFVLGLLLLLQLMGSGWKTLVGTISAFTLAHSITLTLAVLADISLPTTPVETVIALSILLLATEIFRYPQRQKQGLKPTLTARKPWLVAFGFGLLHGFGFAGALNEIGVPSESAAWALLLFNLGVEVGQLLFVFAVLMIFAATARFKTTIKILPITQSLLMHGIGGLAVFWMLERGLRLWT
jgi:hypothetical protein